jgi:hypothetical protein
MLNQSTFVGFGMMGGLEPFAQPMIKTFLGTILNIVVYTIHSMTSIHLPFV